MGWVMPDVFDAGKGLDQTVVTSVVVTPERRVWVGTMRGLYRLSGGRMVEVRGPDDAFRQEIRSLAVDPQGTLWLSTAGSGVFQLGESGWQPAGPQRQGVNAGIFRLTTLGSGKQQALWAVGQGAYVRRDGHWVTMPVPGSIASQPIRDVALQDDATTTGPVVWYATFGDGVHRCDRQGQCRQMTLPPGPRANEVYGLALSPNGGGSDLWISTFGGGVARWHQGQWTRWHTGNSDLPSNYATRLMVVKRDANTQVWVGTRNGPALFSEGRWQPVDNPQPLLRRRVYDMAQATDVNGLAQVWMGMEGGGLRLPLRDAWRVVRHLEPNSNGIMSIAMERGEGAGESVWMTLDGRGVTRYRDGEWRDFTQADGLPRNEVRNVLVVPAGSENAGVWVGDYFGHVSRFQRGRFVEVPTPWPHSDKITARLLLDDPATGFWLSTTGSGLARYHQGKWTWMQPDRIANAPRHAFAGVRVGDTLWFATGLGQGLARYRNGAWKLFDTLPGLSSTSLYSIALLPDERGRDILWIGTDTGVVRIDVGNPEHPIAIADDALPTMPRIQTYDILRDGRGDLLMCTQYGISRLRWTAGRRTAELTEYHQQDGLPHDECNAKAFALDRQGRVWAGSIAGAAVYDPRIEQAPARRSPLMLDEASANDRPLRFTQQALSLLPTQSLHMAFDLPTGSHERLIRYRTQVEGLDEEPSPWTEANTRTWLGLPAGHYRLKIEARDGRGVMAEPLVFDVRVPRPWWQSWPMLLLYAATVIGIFALIYRWRLRQLRASHQRLENTVSERTAALHERGEQLRRMNHELTQISYLDALTGLHNRRFLMEHLRQLWLEHRESATPIAVILFDIDHFKQINDRHGHAAGDQCLESIGRGLHEALRGDDSVVHGRYGGEEFLIILSGATETTAAAIAERLRERTTQCPDIPMSASFGVAATVPLPGNSMDQLLRAADEALYVSKEKGRNRVTCAGLMP